MAKLTKRSVDALPIRETDYFAFDDTVTGFAVRVLPTGKKSYLVQYRAGGRTRRIAIGLHGTVTVEQARLHARELLGRVAKGDNPAEEISQHRGAPTVASVCERFYTDHVLQRCKPTTQREYRRSIDLFIKPAMGSFKIVDVARPDVSKLHHAMRHIPYQANRTLGVLSKLFNLTEVWGLRPDGSNPCRHVKKYAEKLKERYLTAEEVQRLGMVLNQSEANGTETPYVCAAIRLLVLTGRRLREIQTLKWSYLTATHIDLPDSKVGAMRYTLPDPARDILDTLERKPGNPYVIAGEVEGQHVTDLQKPWRRIRAKAGLPDVRIHDLRHTYASTLANSGESIQMIGKMLGHKQIQTTMRYAHLSDATVRKAANTAAASLAGQLGPAAGRVAAE